jgi:predicted transcriptional regulator
VQTDLFGAEQLERPAERVLMSLNPEYYELIWQRLKTHEFRRRYLAGRSTTWFVYLTAPVSTLAAVIELDEAVVDTPRAIADIAERANPGNGTSVYAYLEDLERGYALPIRTVREYEGFTAEQLSTMLDGFHPPQGYTLIDKHPKWVHVCDQLIQQPVARDLVVEHPSSVP